MGLAGSLAATGLLRELLYQVEPFDPVVLVGITAFVAVASVLATLPPSARATSVKPSQALRTE